MKGQCLCGGVVFRIEGPLRDVVNCHCGQCRRFHGHFAPYTSAPRDGIVFEADATLVWFESTPSKVRRGFCSKCGSSMFWDRLEKDTVAIVAGCLESPTGLATSGHIYVADAGDYYRIDDDLPRLPGTSYG